MKDRDGNEKQGGLPRPSATGGRQVTQTEIQAWLVEKISAMVEVSPEQIDPGKPFEHYGLDSMHAMHLSSDLQDWLGRKLSPTIVWDYPTIEVLARHIVTGD